MTPADLSIRLAAIETLLASKAKFKERQAVGMIRKLRADIETEADTLGDSIGIAKEHQ